MKTVFIGDIHGRNIWKQIVENEQPDRVVFMGDYFDSFDISSLEQQHNFKEIIEYKTTTDAEVVMLIGNHDHHYFPGVAGGGTSGFQTTHRYQIQFILEENKHHLQMAYAFDDILCTHAGVSVDFMDLIFGVGRWETKEIPQLINDLWKYRPLTFEFNGMNSYGDDVYQTPIWIRPQSLMKSNYDHLRKEWIQIIGHTWNGKIDIEGKATGGRYYFIDALPKHYLIYENGTFRLGTNELPPKRPFNHSPYWEEAE